MPPEPMPSPTRGLTDALRSLRLAATLARGLPGARLLVHDGTRVRAVARTQPADLPPCALRCAVRSARRTHTLEPVHDLLGLAGGVALECHLTLTDDTVTDLGGGLYTIRSDRRLGQRSTGLDARCQPAPAHRECDQESGPDLHTC